MWDASGFHLPMESIGLNPSLASDYVSATNTACYVILVLLLFRCLNLLSYTEVPTVVLNATPQRRQKAEVALRDVLNACPILRQKYEPPSLFGRNGHLQTAVYGVLGHATLKRTYDHRQQVVLVDGTTVTFDVFEPARPHDSAADYTLALCPGICNSSESNYIRTCVHHAQSYGYRCAVLNHLGSMAAVPLTSSRIFKYGGTDELQAMMRKLMEMYPSTKFISIGFSMGANITTNYLATVTEQRDRDRFLCGLSVCQGYDALRNVSLLHEWTGGRRFYSFVICENVKRLLRRNYERAVTPHVRAGIIDEAKVFATTSLVGIDQFYNAPVQGYKNVSEMYRACSCIYRIPSIEVPMIFLNAYDDPLFPERCVEPVRELCATHERHAFIGVKHGGHLGFLEGWSFRPNSVTWLDRFIVEMANAAVAAREASVDH